MLHRLHSSFDQKKWKNSISKPSAITKRDMAQLWSVCAVFFGFFPCSLQSITQKSIEHRIGCNCGAFAPYFFGFFLSLPVDACVELMHITLNSPGLYRCMCLFHVHGRGISPVLLLCILFLTLVPGRGSFFCTRLSWNRGGGRRASKKRLAPGKARANW